MDPVGISAVGVVLAAGAAVGLWRRHTDGRVQTGRVDTPETLDPALLERLGAEPGRVTLLQFSTAFCAPCRAVRRVSAEVAELLPEIRHVEVDAESHLDEVRELNIWRTPTLLVLAADGRVAKRATGVPTKPHLIAALADLLPS
ncbi:TlpA family protein disulfide reductase [Actinoplanes sp. HUAS TT8]|uniref:TlpA family protein disulfide reductase n=1 Tax=Actinoplanes sp. HUAS TT8 TaxID=3447453 RepID=UPI003F520498